MLQTILSCDLSRWEERVVANALLWQVTLEPHFFVGECGDRICRSVALLHALPRSFAVELAIEALTRLKAN